MVTNTLFWPGALARQLAIIVAVSIPPSTRKKGEGMCGRSSFLSAQPIFKIQADGYYPSYHGFSNGFQRKIGARKWRIRND
ncbi:MAG: hypothetical protein B5M54_09615 [Candidatus Aminicenantes bacterium 4484_214]|nr:MAG: hypothetical protein B5M54_09615 [Candidatus Aminicenantes bacterium 4484_214]